MILGVLRIPSAPQVDTLDLDLQHTGALGGKDVSLGAPALAHFRRGGLRVVAEPSERAPAIAEAFLARGQRCLALLRGRQRFILHDTDAQLLLATSSTTPPWPLAYWSDGATVLVCSQVLPMLQLHGVPRALDESYLVHSVLGLGAMGAGLTAIRGIRRLRPGEALVVDPSGLRLCQFDALAPRTRPRGSKNGPVLVDALSAAVANAVGRGGAVLSLSGGLDSAALAAVDQLRGGTLDAISFAAPGLASSAEVSAVDNMVRAWPSFRVARVDVGESMELPDLGGALRDDPSLIPLALLPSRLKLWAKARAEGFHAIIEGEGGDELFGLLPTPLDALSRARPLAAASQLLRSGGRRELLEFGVILPMLPAGARRALHALRRPVEACLPAFVARAAASQPRVVEAVDEYLAALAHRPFAIRLRDWMSAPMIVGAGLSRRHLANAYGLTLEWPMLERNFIEVVLGLHEEGKLRGGANKPTLQEALEGLVPNAVRRRPKDVSLYLTLIPRILTSHRARTALRNEAVRRRLADLVRFERIEAMLDGLAAGRKLGGDALWQLECVVSFAEWYARASREHGVD